MFFGYLKKNENTLILLYNIMEFVNDVCVFVCRCISEFITHSFTESINDCHHCGYIKNKGKCAAIHMQIN